MLTKTNADLKAFADRLNRLEEEGKALAGDKRDLLEEVKSAGFTPTALKKAAKIYAMDKEARDKHDSAQMDLETYLAALEGRATE